MNSVKKIIALAVVLGTASFGVSADDLIATQAAGKGGRNTVAFDLVTSGESTVVEFVVQLPKGATNVDVSKCMTGVPSSHQGKCQYHEKTGEVIAIAYSSNNALFASGAIGLGSVSYDSLLKGGSAATIRDLVVGNDRGIEIPSNIQTEDALLGN
jgi:hypothetical protein